MKYLRYLKYKDSGIEWIGEIPESWIISRLGNFIKVKSGLSPPNKEIDGSIPIYGANGVIGFTNTPLFLEKKLLVGRVGSSGAVNIADPPCWVSDNALIIDFDSSSINFLFLHYLLSVFDYSVEKSITAQPLITSSDIKSKKAPLPSLEEQLSIYSFLELETSKVDSLISRHEKMIELLKEKHQAIITHAVTKGLHPNVPMKDSGIEWIGEIPKHWELKRLKYASKLITEKSAESTNQVALENVESWTGNYLPSDSEFQADGVKFAQGDILFGKLRPYLAKVMKAESAGEAVGDFYVLRPNGEVLSSFLHYWLLNKDFIEVVSSSTYGAKMPRVDWGFMGNLLMALPSRNEQREICSSLDLKLAIIDSLASELDQIIKLLKEKRTSLITQAVTGKIDVRRLAREVSEPA